MDIFLNLIENFSYYTISYYFAVAIGIVVIPTLVIRLLRIFPYYVKHGDFGDDDNTIWLGDSKRTIRTKIHHFFIETHPNAILTDLMGSLLFTFVVYMAWIIIPFLIAGRLIWIGVAKLANHMRDQHIKKQEFHAVLKGD